jgi:hypothetical protein
LLEEVITSQPAALEAAHVQSRVVVTVTEPAAPDAGTDSRELTAVTSHLEALGELTETDDEPHAQANKESSATTSRGERHNITAPIQ